LVDRKVASKARQLIPWPLEKMRFTEVGGIEGAREALGNGGADTFLWEQLMTKPLVDQGIFRRLGHIDTPWPCFVIVASQKTHQFKRGIAQATFEKLFGRNHRLLSKTQMR